MKRYSLVTGAVALAITVAFVFTATAQSVVDTNIQNQAGQRQAGQRRNMNRGDFGKLDSLTQGSHFRASQLIGANIYNLNEESVGEVSDIVMDARTGRIAYAAVTYGGFLGLGDKMFAVPWEAFQVKADKNDADEYHLCLDVSQEKLDGAKGFDQDHWPNFADRNWSMEVDKRYGVERPMRNRDFNRNRNRGNVDVDVDRNGVNVDVDRDN